MIFDGKRFAKTIEDMVREKVSVMAVKPKIVSILVGDDPASALYTRSKLEVATRVGIEFEIEKLDSRFQIPELVEFVRKTGERGDVTGVMVQLPLPERLRGRTSKLLEMIPLEKDVDGMRYPESGVKPATVCAILTICESIANNQYPIINNQTNSNNQIVQNFWKKLFVVVGARGAVGRPLVHFLRERGVEVIEVEWDTPRDEVVQKCKNAQILISCVGKAGLVTGEMVGDPSASSGQGGVVAIDVGSPKGDMTQEVYEKASIAVPVPHGVGPVTIVCLMQNACDIMDLDKLL